MLPLYEEMITSSSWWDTVDAIAAHLRSAGAHQDVLSGLTKREALKHHPEKVRGPIL